MAEWGEIKRHEITNKLLERIAKSLEKLVETMEIKGELQEKIKKLEDGRYEQFLFWRNISEPCEECDGSGTKTYGSTSTWSKRPGGQIITTDICDKCWGTGDKFRKGTNLRKLNMQIKELEKRIKELEEK